jgi:hypothetical protein
MFGILKKLLGSKRIEVSKSYTTDDLRYRLRKAEKNRDEWKGQANVDATENISLKAKLKKIRTILGEDDEVFSKYSRSQIEDMELEEFIKIEHLIDKDVADGKLFLQ